MSPLHSQRSPTNGSKCEMVASLLPSWGPRGAQVATSPLHSRGPQCQAHGADSEAAASLCPLGGPKEGTNATSHLHSRGPQRQVPGAKSKMATPPLPSWGAKRGQKCYVTLAFLRVPNAKRREQIQEWCPTNRNIIMSGCLTQPSRGPKRKRTCYVIPAFSGFPNKKKQNQKQLPHRCLLRRPKEGGFATQSLHFQGSPMPSAGRESEVAIWLFGGTLTPTLKKNIFSHFLLHSRDTKLQQHQPDRSKMADRDSHETTCATHIFFRAGHCSVFLFARRGMWKMIHEEHQKCWYAVLLELGLGSLVWRSEWAYTRV